MEKVACNFCGGSRQRVILRARDRLNPGRGRFNVARCGRCGLVFVNPRPAREEIASFYPDGYGSHPQALRERKKTSLYKRIPVRLFGDPDIPERLESDPYFVKRRGRVLDVGSGGGELLCEFSKRGWETLGLEPFCDKSPLAEELGVEIRRVSFEDVELPAGHFDVVLMSHVLEHLSDPLGALRKAARVLVSGGLVYVEVPNFDSLSRRAFGTRWFPLEVPRHLSHFTPATVTRLAGAAGLRVSKVRYVAASSALRESLLRLFVAGKYGGELHAAAVNRLLRTPVLKVAAALVSGVIAVMGKSDIVGYYLVKDRHHE